MKERRTLAVHSRIIFINTRFCRNVIFFMLFALFSIYTVSAQYQLEKLDRGVIAVSMGGSKVFISWRWLGTEDAITFNLYRNGTKINATPLTVCNYTDNAGSTTASYTVKAIVNNVEQAASTAVTPWAQQYLKVPITAPAGGTTPDGVAYTYNANDASVADLDGDGAWEIILKWDPTNSKDNSQSGYTGNTFVDAYKMNGTRMWRIDYGVNIRSGAHYMDFMVYDFDGDGKAEVMSRTGDGTIDGTGKVIGTAGADYRSTAGYVLTGPEYMSVFNGMTGAVMATTNYLPARGTVASWGDTYGNRVDRFRAGVAYLDGQRPTGIFCRGYYTRAVVAAWDWRGGKLTSRWVFDSNNTGNSAYFAQGDHSISIADVDNDNKQEVIVGSAIIDDNGSGYYSTTFGHGDALHVSDLDPDLPGLEVFNIQERLDVEGAYMYNALSKTVLWTKPTLLDGSQTEGPGRGVSADISAATRGTESWVAGGGIPGVFDCKGNLTNLATPQSCNFLVWWDGDVLRELLNNTMIDKFGTGRLLTAYNIVPISSNNGTKSTPCLSGDIMGDWREEVIWRATANDALYIFTTTTPSTNTFRTLMHDPQYRVAIAWQNTGYNQPPHLSYYLGDGMATPAKPNIVVIDPANSCQANVTSPSTSFCTGGSVVLSANTGTGLTYTWANAAGTITGATNATYTATAAGAYTVTITNATGCKVTSAATTITVNTLPTATITSPATSFCTGGSIILSANTGTGLTYAWVNAAGAITGATNATYTATAAGVYTVTLTNAAGCKTTSAATTITINTLPTATITSPATSFCTGGSVVLSANTGTGLTYTWANAAGTITGATNATYTATAAGTYTVTVTNAAGCKTTSAATTITVNTLPTATISSPATFFCTGGSVALSANTGTGLTYAWANTTGTITGATNATYTATAAGTYKVTITNAAGCKTTSAATTITINTLPTATITSPATSFCTGGSIVLSANTGTGLTYAWANTTGTITSATNATYTATAASTYTVTVTNTAGCKVTSATTQITVTALPTATITAPSATLCAGGSVVLTSSIDSSYKWFNGTTQVGTASTYAATTGGTYTVEVTNIAGCKATSGATTITVNQLPTATITAGSATTFCTGGSVKLTSSTGSSYKWFNGTTQVGTASTYTATTAGAYTVEVTNAAGCIATSTVTQVGVTAALVWYQDTDGDGKGNPSITVTACTQPTGYVSIAGDACPTDPNKIAAGSCGCGNPETDTDGDGQPDCVDNDDDNDGVPDTNDCAPLDAAIGAKTVWYQDTDGDGKGDPAVTVSACTQPTGYVLIAGDACPSDPNKIAAGFCGCGNPETDTDGDGQPDCVDTDDDNDGVPDTNDCAPLDASITTTVTTWYRDLDGDGKGDPASILSACIQPSGYVLIAGDECPTDAGKTVAGNCGCGYTETSCLDCAGVPNGAALIDNCSICTGGTTGKIACLTTATINGTTANITVTPQPFDNTTTIKLENNGIIQSITIISASGALMNYQTGLNTTEVILGESLSAGLYSVIIQTDSGIHTTKIVKK